MKAGTEDKKKVGLLIGLSVVAAIVVYTQFFGGSERVLVRPARPAVSAARPRQDRNIPTRTAARVGRQFEPIWRRSHEDESFDPLTNDPTLQTDLLAAVRNVEFSGVDRNIFRFTERKKIVAPPPQPDIDEAQRRQEAFAARARQTKPAPAPKKPRAPRLTWKYYGFASDAGAASRRAFLLDGEDVLIGGEGDVFKRRYEITHIGLTSITIKDRQFNEEQTLAITVPQG